MNTFLLCRVYFADNILVLMGLKVLYKHRLLLLLHLLLQSECTCHYDYSPYQKSNFSGIYRGVVFMETLPLV